MQIKLPKAFYLLVLLLILGFTLLLLSALIPQRLLKKQIIDSSRTLSKETQYPTVGFPFRKIILDNFTDSLRLNIAYSIDNSKPLESLINDIRYETNDNKLNQVNNLKNLINNENIHPVKYERYWHGYLIFLRPLLIFFSYQGIRNIISLLLFMLVFYSLYLLKNKIWKGSALALLVGLLYTDFLFIGRSIQFSTTYIIGLSGLIFLLKKEPKGNNLLNLFLFVGILTSFFDLLTTPIITFGLLWFGAILISDKKENKSIYISKISIKKFTKEIISNIKTYSKYFFYWSLGYIIIWISKWIIAELTFSKGAIINAINQTITRMGTTNESGFNYFETIKRNIFQLIGYDKSNKIFFLVILVTMFIIVIKYGSYKKININKIIGFSLLSLFPYIWYLFTANHSFIHVWFTYRSQLLTVIGIVMIFIEIVKNNN